MLSQTAEYALRAVLYVAAHEARDGLVKIDEIAGELDVPRNTLAKTLHVLGRTGVLASVRGPAGGFRLAVRPEALSLARVVAPFDAVGQGRRCLLGRTTCSDAAPCAAHGRWKAVSERVSTFFADTTIADLLGRTTPARLHAML